MGQLLPVRYYVSGREKEVIVHHTVILTTAHKELTIVLRDRRPCKQVIASNQRFIYRHPYNNIKRR